jgi:hypothetical protein
VRRSPSRTGRGASPARRPVLGAPGWNPVVRTRLERWIRAGAGRGLPAVFDFDNTIVCGDIGEATLAWLARDGRVALDQLPASLTLEFRNRQGRLVSPSTASDATAYYEDWLDPTAHGTNDPAPLANGYVWAVEAMAGLSVRDVIQATRRAFARSEPGKLEFLEVTPGGSAYPVPWFYPESVELMAALLRAEFDVWIVSASNVWSVRWLVLHGLNPLLRAHGLRRGLAADRVVGVSLLLQDSRGRLLKDAVLVQEDAGYASLDGRRLAGLRLTSRLVFPVPTYSGKVACLWDLLGRRPYFAVGDSPGDHAMLGFSERRLWIARVEKPDYLRATRKLARATGPARWLFQGVRVKAEPGFLPEAP